MSLLRMEFSFNDKITGKLQNYSFKLNWICLPDKHLKTVLLEFLSVILMSRSIDYLVAATHYLNFNRFHDPSPLQ